jgi:hypothetical protein
MSNGTSVQHHELEACQSMVEHKILMLETQMLAKVSFLEKEIQRLIEIIQTLVTQQEFWPIKMFVIGLSSGVLVTALGAVMARILGWS